MTGIERMSCVLETDEFVTGPYSGSRTSHPIGHREQKGLGPSWSIWSFSIWNEILNSESITNPGGISPILDDNDAIYDALVAAGGEPRNMDSDDEWNCGLGSLLEPHAHCNSRAILLCAEQKNNTSHNSVVANPPHERKTVLRELEVGCLNVTSIQPSSNRSGTSPLLNVPGNGSQNSTPYSSSVCSLVPSHVVFRMAKKGQRL